MDYGRGCQWKAWVLLRSSRLFHSVLKWADSSRSVMSVSQLGLNSGKSLELRFIHIPSQENQQADRLLERERGQRNLKPAKKKEKKKEQTDRQTTLNGTGEEMLWTQIICVFTLSSLKPPAHWSAVCPGSSQEKSVGGFGSSPHPDNGRHHFNTHTVLDVENSAYKSVY